MGQRLDLHEILVGITPKVYFSPPPSVRMEYPCIVYQRDNAETVFAGNRPYSHVPRYQVTVIDRNPDSDIREKVAALPMCSYSRFFTANGLNHDIFVLYF